MKRLDAHMDILSYKEALRNDKSSHSKLSILRVSKDDMDSNDIYSLENRLRKVLGRVKDKNNKSDINFLFSIYYLHQILFAVLQQNEQGQKETQLQKGKQAQNKKRKLSLFCKHIALAFLPFNVTYASL